MTAKLSLNLSLGLLLDRVTAQIAKSAKLAPENVLAIPRLSFDGEAWTVSARVAPRNDARVRATDVSAHGETPELAVEEFIRVLPLWEQVLAPSRPARKPLGRKGPTK